ncbi:MAG: beta-galactosidase [Clostridiales bacterium]|nr:beta-galactosidase [Clostridiales bacterium]
MSILTIKGDSFYLNDEPFTLLSGAIHYYRVVPEYWEDRLLKLRACGFNTVETYVAWNMHEPKPGEFCFEGICDIEKFIETAEKVGLHVIVRPGPYVCTEWEFGGLPAWLLKDQGMRIRCGYQPYLDAVDRFFDELIKRLVPYQSTNGGPIIAMQVENEYGSFGNDSEYLEYLKKGMIDRGVDVLLFTSDGPTDVMMQGGTLPDVFKTANFGSRPEQAFSKLREYQPTGPLVCMEYWNGWFDHWGKEHKTRDGKDVADVLDKMLSMDAGVNFYMFHGGTNFGFMNGANHGDGYEPTVSSYDYDAPLSEAGDPTPKYFAVRDVIKKHYGLPDIEVPKPLPKKAYGKVELTKSVALFDCLNVIGKKYESHSPLTMEEVDQNYGFILYRTNVTGPRENAPIILQEVRDRALVFKDKENIGTIYRNDKESNVTMDVPKEGAQLDVLVENMGRVNYGPEMPDRKGVTKGIRFGYQYLYNWDIYTLELDNIDEIPFKDEMTKNGPTFYLGELEVDKPHDTFLALPGWTKGICFVNGFNLGRYWGIGPTKTLYVPAPLLKKGKNSIVVFELHGMEKPIIEFRDKPELG